jgi:hypothetical protein
MLNAAERGKGRLEGDTASGTGRLLRPQWDQVYAGGRHWSLTEKLLREGRGGSLHHHTKLSRCFPETSSMGLEGVGDLSIDAVAKGSKLSLGTHTCW